MDNSPIKEWYKLEYELFIQEDGKTPFLLAYRLW